MMRWNRVGQADGTEVRPRFIAGPELWRRISVVALLAVVMSFCFGTGGLTAARADDVNVFGTINTGTVGLIQLGNQTDGSGSKTPVVVAAVGLTTTPPVSTQPGAPSSATIVPFPGQTVDISVEATNGVWWPLCTATTNASGIAS